MSTFRYFSALFCALLVTIAPAFAQSPPNFPADNFSSANNPLYWRNRKPRPDYWQQDVHYYIQAALNPDSNQIAGKLQLTYTNNSPDELSIVYFHLYQNAYTPDSYRDALVKANHRRAKYGPHEGRGRGTQVTSVRQTDSNLRFEVDNTIMKVYLSKPLKPGATTTFMIDFDTWFDNGSEERRMKILTAEVRKGDGTVYTVKHFDGVHWYPRVAVYDHKFTWETSQHLGKEFYGEFGTYDVSLTLPAEYILDATGTLLNKEEVLPADLRAKLDLKNFKSKPWGEPASELIAPGGGAKTWHFHAENVHDFAWTADPTYRIGTAEWKGVECIALARESHASGWQDAADFAAKVIMVYSEDIGAYGYPKMIVADADDGMEYPMLTLDGGRSPGYYGLFAHEIGHNWFYGMVGSNETYRAALDEGFTQFLTAWCMRRLVGNTITRNGVTVETKYGSSYYNYLRDARNGYEGTLNTHSNHFHGSLGHENGYRSVYHKTATMLFNLEYVLGTEKFLGAMKHYFNKWKFAHPYPEDFREAVTEYTNMDLTWFFDEWMEQSGYIDYAVSKCSKKDTTWVKLSREGDMVMPITLTAVTEDGDSLHYLIPVTDYNAGKPGFTLLPKWTGHDLLHPEYEAALPTTEKIKKIIIDPTHYLADVNLLNNQTGCAPVKVKFSLLPQPGKTYPLWEKYDLNIRPSLWYNGYAGLQAGVSMYGSYLQSSGKTFLRVLFSTGLGAQESPEADLIPFENDFARFNYQYRYETPVKQFGKLFDLKLSSNFLDGLHKHSFGFSKKWAKARADNPDYKKLSAGYTFMRRNQTAWNDYLLLPDQWNAGINNTFFEISFEKGYQRPGMTGRWNIEVRASALGSNRSYGWIKFEETGDWNLSKFLLRYRLFAQYGDGRMPLESALYLSGGNPESLWNNDFFRSRGFFPASMLDNDLGRQTYHVHYGGGMNLRGYAGYRPEYGDFSPAWWGYSGCSYSAELEFGKFIGWRPAFFSRFLQTHLYLFHDGGVLFRRDTGPGFPGLREGIFRINVGPGIAVDIMEKHLFQNGPLTLRFDMPLWLSRTPAREENFQFRWMLGVGRSF